MRLHVVLLLVVLFPAVALAGSVTGKVTFTGTPAKPRPIDMSDEPDCQKQSSSQPMSETVVTGAGNALANVVIWVSAGADDEGTVPPKAVTFYQKGCMYVPHVAVMHTGQELQIVNSDQTLHNVHPVPKLNREWNKSQTAGAPAISEKYDKEEIFPVKCNVHPWMRGWFVVLKTNHFDVSKGDGTFTIPNLPPGKYTLTAWQESYGKQTQDITITGNENKSIEFKFTAQP
jgi:plastocyanin